MTKAEKIICKLFLEDLLEGYSTCNEYKLLMGLLEKEPCIEEEAAKESDYCPDGSNRDSLSGFGR